ncbi:MAG: lactate racemase domain-containing protein, partial [candidate division WOR-3 bacterium]
MKKELALTYGNEKVNISVPEDFLAGDLIEPRKSDNKMTEAEMKEKMEEAIKNPIDSPLVKEIVKNAKVGLAISDEFRSGLQELIVSVMIEEIFKGNPESLNIFIANGTHNPKVYCVNLVTKIKEISKYLGHEINIIVNECDSDKYVDLGITPLGTAAEIAEEWLKTEVRIYGHESKYHYMNG